MPPRSNSPYGIERVVLLGFMCSGKSTVGESLARRLEWTFLDFDVEIEHREELSISSIIDRRGEDYFRSLEAALTREVAEEPFLVLAPGGGWITQPDLLDRLGAGTLSCWLDVSPRETARRLHADPIDRPFKELSDPTGAIAEMLADREPLYRLADARIPAESRSAEEIAFEIEQLVRTRGIAARSRN